MSLKDVYHNGSLWNNLELYSEVNGSYTNNGSIPWLNPRVNTDPGAQITFFPNATINLQFHDTGQNLELGLSLMASLADKEKELMVVNCMYPLSGQYSHLPRFLFYAALVFAFLFRHRSWLAEAALGIVMVSCASMYEQEIELIDHTDVLGLFVHPPIRPHGLLQLF